MWQLPLFLNVVFAAVRGFFDKKLVSKIDPFVAFFYVVLWGTVFYYVIFIFRHHAIPPVYPGMMFLGVLYALAVGTYLAAVQISLSQSVIFASYYLLIALILAAVFLGEWQFFDPTVAAGQRTILGMVFAAAALGIFLFTGNKKEGKLERKWILFIAINIIVNGIGTYWGKVFIGDHGPLETLISQSLGGLPVLFIFNFLRKKDFRIHTGGQILAAMDAAAMVVALSFYYQAIKKGPLTIILPIQTLGGTILIALIGLVLFDEAHKFTRLKMVGMAAGVVGIVLLMMS